MNTEALIYQALSQIARCDPDIFRQNASGKNPLPALRYTVVGGVNAVTNYGNQPEGQEIVRIQIDVLAATPEQRSQLRSQVRKIMDELTPPAVIDTPTQNLYEEGLNAYRSIMIYNIFESGKR